MTNPWDAVFERVRCEYDVSMWYPPKPTDAELDAIEKELGFVFPASYRAFAKRFGLHGRLFVLVETLSLQFPQWVKPNSGFTSVVKESLDYRAGDYWYGDAELPPWYSTMVVFAIDGGYHTFAFDATHPTDSTHDEYQINDINRDNESRRIADSFSEWLEWLDDHYNFEDEEEDDEPLGYPSICVPAEPVERPIPYRLEDSRQKKAEPNPSDVETWLAENNDTVRNLARSLRNDQQAEAFPILADALEDAGCDHGDLLRACREGDPEVDGVWVLHVLLGPE